jgi:aminoglycoside 6-adenylyltransferase
MRTESEVLTQFKEWAQNNELVRAALLTGSRANPNSQPDALSDYDIALYVTDLCPFQESDSWLSIFGTILVRWPLVPCSTFDKNWLTRLILFDDGVRIDFQITEATGTDPNASGNDFRVLIDKDGLIKYSGEPDFSAYNIHKPSAEEYKTIVHEFWWDATYVPKYLWRDELPMAKYMLDDVLRFSYLHRLIEWYIGQQHDWAINAGCYGRWFKRYLSAWKWSEYESTYVGSGIEENWAAFFSLVDLFRTLAKEVGSKLGYEYPVELDEKVTDYFSVVRHKRR